MKVDGRNTWGRLALLGVVSFTLAIALYITLTSSSFKASSQQGAFEESLVNTHDHQRPTTLSYLHSAQEATSDLENLLEKDIASSDLSGKGLRVSALSTLLEAIIEDPTIPRDNFFRFLTHEFNWWRHSSETYLPYGERIESNMGIVMCVGQKDLVLAAQNIRTLRNVLGSTLPIQIFYAGEHDFPWEKRKQLGNIDPNIDFLNILDYYDDTVAGINDSLVDNGWVMKPFALLASGFQKAILVDADTIFLQRPDSYFDDDIRLKETGTLFYHDRAVKGGYTGFVPFVEICSTWDQGLSYNICRGSNRILPLFRPIRWIDTLKWIKEVLKDRKPSAMLRESIFWTAKLEHQQESGVVFMDKGKPGVFMSLAFATWMNTKLPRQYIYEHVFGDKETFWLSCELTSTPYHFNPFYTGMIGHYEVGAEEMCSVQLLHLDSKGNPFWLNGGLRENKRLDHELGQKDLATLTNYIQAGATWPEQPRWRYLKHGVFCTDANTKNVRSVEKAGLTKIIDAMMIEAIEVDKMFPD